MGSTRRGAVAVVTVVGILLGATARADAQGCTAARGCPTITPPIPGGSFSGGNNALQNFAAPDASFASFSPAPAQTSEPSVQISASQALIRVNVPDAAARVWFQGAATQRPGASRLFVSPTLTSGRNYRYTVRCAWQENGREVVRQRQVLVQPGRETVVDF